jgi:hypothetical protein
MHAGPPSPSSWSSWSASPRPSRVGLFVGLAALCLVTVSTTGCSRDARGGTATAASARGTDTGADGNGEAAKVDEARATVFEPTKGAAAGAEAGAEAAAKPGAPSPVAVVELYTSEGCSSCPSADRIVNELDKSALAAGRPVYVLAFHVDYWDDIGWPDPYSDAAFTARQRVRGARAGQRGIYTPEAAVQGRPGFVGSDGARVQREVEAALKAPAKARFAELAVDRTTSALRYRLVGGLPPAARVQIAVTQRGIVTDVRSGENAGRKLPHESVVRRFVSQDGPTGTVALGPLPARGAIVAFVEASDGAILGASAIDIEGDRLSLR